MAEDLRDKEKFVVMTDAARLSCLLSLLLALAISTANADVPVAPFVAMEGRLDAFMTGMPLAVDGGDADSNADTLALPASVAVTSADVPVGATLLRAFLYWGGTQADGGAADSSVTFTPPGGTPSAIAADVCHHSDGASASYDMFLCRAEVTSVMLAAGGALIGSFTVDDYSGLVTNGSADNASAAALLIFEDSSLPGSGVVASDGLMTMQSGSTVLTESGFVASESSGEFTYYVLEGDIAGTGTEEVSITGQPSGTGPLILFDAVNPPDNPMNRTINTTSPPQTDVIGVDVDRFSIAGALTAGDTTLDVGYSAGADRWWLGAQVSSVRSTVAAPVPALGWPLGPRLLGGLIGLSGAGLLRAASQRRRRDYL